jgi:hypothetical protein
MKIVALEAGRPTDGECHYLFVTGRLEYFGTNLKE